MLIGRKDIKMREIKYRVFNSRDKIMHYDITGFEFYPNGNISGVFIDGVFLLIEEIELMQYTGLKDEDDIDIYEGDIIEFSYDMFVGNFDTFVAKGVVVFDEGAFYVEVFENERTTKDESYLLYNINIDSIKVIGNKYNNPVLLEE